MVLGKVRGHIVSPWSGLGVWACRVLRDGPGLGVLGHDGSHQGWWSDHGVPVSEPGLLSGKDGAVDGRPRCTGGYGNPLEPTEESGAIAEEGRQNKLGNSPNPGMTPNIWTNGDFRINCVTQWTLEGFLHPWISEIDIISELSKPLKQNPQNMLLVRDLRLILGGCSPSLGTGDSAASTKAQ